MLSLIEQRALECFHEVCSEPAVRWMASNLVRSWLPALARWSKIEGDPQEVSYGKPQTPGLQWAGGEVRAGTLPSTSTHWMRCWNA